MKTKKRKYVSLPMRFNQGLMKYEPKLPLKRKEEEGKRKLYDEGLWKTLLKAAAMAAAWAFLVWLLYSSTR